MTDAVHLNDSLKIRQDKISCVDIFYTKIFKRFHKTKRNEKIKRNCAEF